MKKSRIIAPAAAILVFSSAAAVTGTVAWFTASRIADLSISSITAVNPEAGLVLELAQINNAGATKVADKDESDNVIGYHIQNTALRDASVYGTDTSDPLVYKSVLDGDGELNSFALVGTNGKADGTNKLIYGSVASKDVYYANAFDANITLGSEVDTENYHVFFDQVKSSATMTGAQASGTDKALSKAFRIGMKSDDDQWIVWAPFYASATQIKNVTGLTKTDVAAVADTYSLFGNNVADATGSSISETELSSTAAAGKKEYLGTLDGSLNDGDPDDKDVLKVTVYTWFEGTDENCVNEAKEITNTFAANLVFKAVKNAA